MALPPPTRLDDCPVITEGPAESYHVIAAHSAHNYHVLTHHDKRNSLTVGDAAPCDYVLS